MTECKDLWKKRTNELTEQKDFYNTNIKDSLEKGCWVAVGGNQLMGTFDSREKAEKYGLINLKDGYHVIYVTKVGFEKEIEEKEKQREFKNKIKI